MPKTLEITDMERFDDMVAQFAKKRMTFKQDFEEAQVLFDNPLSWLFSLSIIEHRAQMNLANYRRELEANMSEQEGMSKRQILSENQTVRKRIYGTELVLSGVIEHKRIAATIYEETEYPVLDGHAVTELLAIRELACEHEGQSPVLTEIIDRIDTLVEDHDEEQPVMSTRVKERVNQSSFSHLWHKKNS